ncbi:MAG: beta-1,6-N-acetylglucosaminyltransferase [Prevotellaceae bacterium]|nr:beta-1,6-N-acetylglucosaminyltransferase [Prevotellaceae bacterium]
MKHAYLIIAHNEFEILNLLLRAIDDERNDIYIHFDRKITDIPACRTAHAKMFILSNPTDVRWGDVSVVEAEYKLFEAAYVHGGYSYYHLLSGVDFPLKSQDYIHRFMEKNADKEFIGYYQGDISKEIERKVCLWHLFPKSFRGDSTFDMLMKKGLRALFIRLQLWSGIRRNQQVNFRKGTQWVSVAHSLVSLLLQKKDEVMRTYSHTFCADEIFVQTICWNSSFREHIYKLNDEGDGCMRMIGWKNNELIEWTEDNFDELIASNALFARKFSSAHIGVVRKIMSAIGL